MEVSKVEYEERIWDRTLYNAFLYERHQWDM